MRAALNLEQVQLSRNDAEMKYIKATFVGIAFTVMAYFFFVSMTLIAVTLMPVIKYVAVMFGLLGMYLYLKSQEKDQSDV